MNREVIKIENLSVLYGQNYALKDINLTIYENDYLGIIGPNGGGKTTLIKAILGLIPIQKGSIEIFGKKIDYKDRIIAYVPQVNNTDRMFPITVIDNVLLGLTPKRLIPFQRFTKKEKQKAYQILEQFLNQPQMS